jgi:hypothetical protein
LFVCCHHHDCHFVLNFTKKKRLPEQKAPFLSYITTQKSLEVITKYEGRAAFSGMMFILSQVKIDALVQKFLGEKDIYMMIMQIHLSLQFHSHS